MTQQRILTSGATPREVAADLASLLDFQPAGISLDALRSLLETQLVPHLMHYNQPSFQSMFNVFPPPEALLGAEMGLAYNQGVTNWQVSPGGAMLEELCGHAICRLFGVGEEADATFMYSGTYANQQALYLALHRFAERQGFALDQKGIGGFASPQKLALLVSADAHFSIRHAVRMLGLGEECIVSVPVDANRHMVAEAAQQLVAEMAERDFFCVIATTGTTSTGSVDPIIPLADLAETLGAWFHIDGAYGYAYKLVPEWAHLFAGDERADSITWDPHKQLGAPIPNSMLLLKDGQNFGRMSLYSGYFNRAEDVEPNPGLKSPPTTRPFSALPLVTILRGQGLVKVVEDLRSPLQAIDQLYEVLLDRPGITLFHKPDTGILCFQMTPPGMPEEALNRLQRQLYEQVMATGTHSISTTILDGKMVLRLALVSPIAQLDDLLETIELLEALESEIVETLL